MWIKKGVLVGIGLFLMRMLVGLVPALGHFEPAPIPSSWASVTWWWQTRRLVSCAPRFRAFVGYGGGTGGTSIFSHMSYSR